MAWTLSTPALTQGAVPGGRGSGSLRDSSSRQRARLSLITSDIFFFTNPQLPPDLTQDCSILPGWGSLAVGRQPGKLSSRATLLLGPAARSPPLPRSLTGKAPRARACRVSEITLQPPSTVSVALSHSRAALLPRPQGSSLGNAAIAVSASWGSRAVSDEGARPPVSTQETSAASHIVAGLFSNANQGSFGEAGRGATAAWGTPRGLDAFLRVEVENGGGGGSGNVRPRGLGWAWCCPRRRGRGAGVCRTRPRAQF